MPRAKDKASTPTVCPLHKESFQRIETLIEGKIDSLSAVVRSDIASQTALNTRFEKLIDRLEKHQDGAAKATAAAIEKAFELRCIGPKVEERIRIVERRLWMWAGGFVGGFTLIGIIISAYRAFAK